MDKWETAPSLKEVHLQPGHTVDEQETLGDFVDKIKAQKSSHRTYVVMSGKLPIGIIRSVDMFRLLGTRYGVALNYKKLLREVMYPNILIVDLEMKVDEVSRKAMGRAYEDIYDDIVVSHLGEFIGVLPVYELLTFITDYQIKEAVQKNPLSGLPGNESIQNNLLYKIEQKNSFSVVYVDIDHFKSYNDVYGFKYGDDIIKWVSNIINSINIPELYVGHIGGDDFVSILSQSYAEEYCKRVIDRFEAQKERFYTAEDFQHQYILSLDREHRVRRFPLISLSLVIVDIDFDIDVTLNDISKAAACKKQAKQINGSSYVRCSYLELFLEAERSY